MLEALLVTALVALVLALAAERQYSSVRALRETALVIELSNLRASVTRYAMIKGRLPSDLRGLTTETMEIPPGAAKGERRIVFKGRFIEAASTDGDGFPLDPFGARYGYDPATGRVWSASRGYEGW